MELSDYILGDTAELQSFDGRLDNREVVLSLCSQAQQQIRIFTPDLENPVYDNPDLIRALTVLTTRNRKTHIKVLIKDSTQAIKTGHRLIELSRRLTSSIFLHRMPAHIENRDTAFLIVDNSGYCHKHVGTLYHGQFNFNDKIKVRDLGKFFDDAWDQSRADPEMRQLFI